MGVPPPTSTPQPSATRLLLVNEPKLCVWTLTLQCWIEPHDTAWKSCWAKRNPQEAAETVPACQQTPPCMLLAPDATERFSLSPSTPSPQNLGLSPSL